MAKFVKMATRDELPPGAGKEVAFEGRVYALFNVDGEIHVIDGICPHQGGPLAEGDLDGCMVACPWHGWRFNVITGGTPLGPKIKLDVFEAKLEGDDVLVLVP